MTSGGFMLLYFLIFGEKIQTQTCLEASREKKKQLKQHSSQENIAKLFGETVTVASTQELLFTFWIHAAL